MSKSASLIRLMNKGLNTPEFEIIGTEQELKKWSSLHSEKSVKHGFSIRCERGDEFVLPFIYGVGKRETMIQAKKLLGEGYLLILCPTIDKRACKVKGTATYFPNDQEVLVEYLVGPGVVRDMEQGANPRQLRITDPVMVDPPYDELYAVMKQHFSGRPEIVEWSEYKRPVGRLKEHLIFWEVRPWQ